MLFIEYTIYSNMIYFCCMAKKRFNTIKERLVEKEKSIYWLANETELSYSLLHSYVSGKREPGLENLSKIAKTLKVPGKDLINF